MTRKRIALMGALLALGVAPSASAALQIRQVDTSGYPRIGVTLVASQPRSANPVLRENGHGVAGLSLQNLGREKAIVLAIDRSQSMEGRAFRDALAGARSFIDAKGLTDRIAVVGFGSHATVVQPLSAGAAGDSLAPLHVDPKSGTSLYDALVLSSKVLGRQELLGRVIIVLTDGKDVSSRASLTEAIAAAQKAGALVFPIAITSHQFDPTPLKDLARDTGGRYNQTGSTAELRSIYHSIAVELSRTWHASYLTNATEGETIKLAARLRSEGGAVKAAELPGNDSGVVGASPLIPSFLYGPVGSVALALLLTGLAALVFWSMRGAQEASWVKTRLAPHVGETRARRLGARERLTAVATIFAATEHAFAHFDLWRKLTRMLERADSSLRTVELVWIMLGSAFGAGLLLAVLGQPGLLTLVAMAIAGATPVFVIWMKMKRRRASFETQLPDLLVTMAATLKAGHSFKQGMQAVVDEGRQPASDEFRRVLTETSLGRPMDDALREMSERIGSENFAFVITAVTIQRQVGGSLADLMDMAADVVRQRQQFARKIKALTSMGRMSAYVLVGLPFFMAGTITLMNPEYMKPLWSTSVGHTLIAGSLMGMLIGGAMLKKIVSFRG